MEQKRKLTRREFARGVAIGAAGLVIASAETAHAADTTMPTPQNPEKLAGETSQEGEALIKAVPANVGYALTETQTTEVRTVLQNYPGEFGKARTFPIPDDVLPAFISTSPASSGWKGTKK